MANFVLRRTDSRSILGPDPDGFGFGLLESRTEGMSAPKLVERPLYGMRRCSESRVLFRTSPTAVSPE
jgi:hypothetical protein